MAGIGFGLTSRRQAVIDIASLKPRPSEPWLGQAPGFAPPCSVASAGSA